MTMLAKNAKPAAMRPPPSPWRTTIPGCTAADRATTTTSEQHHEDEQRRCGDDRNPERRAYPKLAVHDPSLRPGITSDVQGVTSRPHQSGTPPPPRSSHRCRCTWRASEGTVTALARPPQPGTAPAVADWRALRRPPATDGDSRCFGGVHRLVDDDVDDGFLDRGSTHPAAAEARPPPWPSPGG